MQFEYNGHTFDIDQVTNDDQSIDIVITHLKPQPVTTETIEKRNRLVEEDTGEKDKEGRNILRKVNQVEEVTIQHESIELQPVKVGQFKLYAEVDRRTLKKMLRNWSMNSKKMNKITASNETESND